MVLADLPLLLHVEAFVREQCFAVCATSVLLYHGIHANNKLKQAERCGAEA